MLRQHYGALVLVPPFLVHWLIFTSSVAGEHIVYRNYAFAYREAGVVQ